MTNLEFVNIPAHILNLNLHINHKFILSLANSFEKGCFLSNAKIGKLLGISANRVSHIISELVELKLLTRTITYKEDSKEVDKRTIFFNKAIKTVQETIKKVVSNAKNKSKEIKSDYVSVETKVGTEKVQQQSFGSKWYKKTDKKARFNNIAQHNWNMDALERLEQERNFTLGRG